MRHKRKKVLHLSIKSKISLYPVWLPLPLKSRVEREGRLQYSFRFNRAERRILKKKRQIPVSSWAEKHRIITTGPLAGAWWRNSVTPYLQGVMDASFFASVQTIIICAAPQTGKSEAVHNCIGYAADRNPGPVLYVYPDEMTARDNSRDRIQTMIEASPRLRSYMTAVHDDLSSMRINLQHMQIYMAWARSAARLANKPIRYVVFDETDKYPDTAGKREADPISLGEKRTTTYKWNRKIWKLSTPGIETGPIWVALTTEAQVIFDYWVSCPECQVMQLMVFDKEHFKFPEGVRDPEKIEAEKLAWYECDRCRVKWDDELRNRAVRTGQWRSRESNMELSEYLAAFRPKKIGFHIPSWISYFVSLSEVAAAFLKGLKDKTKLKDFCNAYQAIPWVHYHQERKEDVILALRDDRSRGMVPGGGLVTALTAGIDTQQHGFWYEIRAWGWGMEKESWQIREGYVTSLEALKKIIIDDYYEDPEGVRYFVRLAIMDAMGGTQRQTTGVGTRTSEVYAFCRNYRARILPLKGEQHMSQPVTYNTKLHTFPGTSKLIPGGLMLFRADVTFFKNELSRLVDIAPGDPGAWHLHAETTEEWARQMTAEYRDEKGLWQCLAGRDNHAWDCSVYNLAAAHFLDITQWKKQGVEVKKSGRRVISAGHGGS